MTKSYTLPKPLSYLIAALAIFGLLFFVGYKSHAETVTSVTTDKTKYSVGEPMVINGAGFSVNTSVDIAVARPDQVTDHLSANSDSAGSFSVTYNTIDKPGRYKITATDGTNVAKTAATQADAIGYNKAIYKKGAALPNNDTSGTWTTGNAGSNYQEGQWVFYEYQVTGVTSTVPGFDIYYDEFPGTGLFIDALNNMRACVDTLCEGVNTSGPATGMLKDGVPTPPSTIAGGWVDAHTAASNINHPFISNACSSTFDSSNSPSAEHCFHVTGSTLQSLLNAAHPGIFGSNTHTVTFYVEAHLAKSSVWTSGKEYLLGCLGDSAYATPGGWALAGGPYGTDAYNQNANPCSSGGTAWTGTTIGGAGLVSGSSGHFNLNPTIGSNGAITLPIPTVAAPTGSITIVKVTNPNPSTNVAFPFTGDLGNFTLDTDPSTTNSNTITFTQLSGGSVLNVTEGATSGWGLTNLVCVNNTGTSAFAYNGTTATITLANTANAAVTCTYTNTINQVAPTVTTTIHDTSHNPVTSVAAGSTVHDSVSVTGGNGTPSGNVTFAFFNNGTCNGTPVATSGSVALDANGAADATAFPQGPLGAGSYSFKAHYVGDQHYFAGDGSCEPLTVTKVTPSISTTQSVGGVIGVTLNDTASVTGGFNPTGNVTFKLFAPSDATCSGSPAYTDTDSTAPYGTNPGFVSNATGVWHWTADYAGDANNNAVSSGCAAEPVTVGKASPALSTTIHDASHSAVTSVALGSTVHDSASISGGSSPTGNVEFTFYTSASCTTGGSAAGIVALSGGTAHPSAAQGPLAAGSYSFKAHYVGDSNNNAVDADCEPLTVNKAQLSVSTIVHDSVHTDKTNAHVALGSIMHDTATVTGGVAGFTVPTPTFTLTSAYSGSCSAGAAVANNGTEGSASKSADSAVLGAGVYAYRAVATGDSNYIGATGDCEPFTVDKAQLTIGTTIHNAAHAAVTNVPLGSVVHDTAQIGGQVGAIAPTGAVTFTFSATCGQGAIATSNSLDGSDPRSVDTSALSAGSYNFQGSIAGDANYEGATSSCEPLTVNKAQLSVSTIVHNAAHVDKTNGHVPLGSVMHDTATVSGAVAGFAVPTPTFTLTSGYTDSCSAGVSVANDGTEGSADKSADSSALGAGSYAYRAAVAGNDNYEGATGTCEPFIVDKAKLSVSTIVHDANHNDLTNGQVEKNAVMHDTATVTGAVAGFAAPDPTFTLTSSYNGTCSAGTSVVNNGTEGSAFKSADSSPLGFGKYAYRASVAGDSNYIGAAGACEPFWVINPHTTISIVSNTQETAPGENVILTITDTNDGDVPLTSPSVVLTYGATTVTLDKTNFYISGDVNNNGIMDVGEAWTWSYTVMISSDTTFNVAGHGFDPLGMDVSPQTGFTSEAGSISVRVIGTTRTLGFWQTHTSFTTSVFNAYPITVGDNSTHKGPLDIAKIFGGFYAPIAKTTTGTKRTPSDQARITLLQQLLAAKLNCAAFGCSPTVHAQIATADADYVSGNKSAIMADISILDAYNNSGDSGAIPPVLQPTGKATPKDSQAQANISFWDQP